MNKVTLIGHLCQNAEQGTTADGKTYVKIRLAVNQRMKGQDTVLFVTAFSRSEAAVPYLVKGKQVYVEGSFSLSTYISRDNQPLPSMTVNASHLELLGGPDRQQSAPQSAPQQSYNAAPKQSAPQNDGLPF